MELYLKRYFWLVHVAVVVICAILSAKAVNHIVEAKLVAAMKTKKKKKPKTDPKPQPAVAAAGKDGAAVLARNMFCSSCEAAPPPAPPPVDGAPPPAVATGTEIPMTTLPLTLHVVALAEDPEYSMASISNGTTNQAGNYFLHDNVPGAGPIVNISWRYVDFENPAAGRVERIDLLATGVPRPAEPPPVAGEQPPPAEAKAPADQNNPEAAFLAEVDKGVKKIDDTHYEIDRGLVDKVLGDPNLIARQARIVPSIKDGKSSGFKVYAIRPNSVYAKIGLQNGDTITAVNGFEMTSPDKALEVYTKVKSASNLTITLTRRGQPVDMEYGIK